jgi:hypothetical protein
VQDERGDGDDAEAPKRSQASRRSSRRARPGHRRGAGRGPSGVTGSLHEPVDPGELMPARHHRHERELGRLREREPGPSRPASTRMAATESSANASAAATASCASDAISSTLRASRLSTTSPAMGASTTRGVQSARKRPAIARPDPLVSWIRNPQEKVAERRDADGADKQPNVTLAERTAVHRAILKARRTPQPARRYPCTPGARSSAG